jgi:hypothetical protein
VAREPLGSQGNLVRPARQASQGKQAKTASREGPARRGSQELTERRAQMGPAGERGERGEQGPPGPAPSSWTFEYRGATYTCTPDGDGSTRYTCRQTGGDQNPDLPGPLAAGMDPYRRQYP